MRSDGRPNDRLREVQITRGFTKAPAGSVLWQQGGTVVLCTASITQELPPWFKETRPGGWLTCEYLMLPASTPQRKPWPKVGHTDSRGTEIQRLIGRVLRSVVDLDKIGPHTIAVDCQVLQADGGTRTAAICGAYVALVDAVARLPEKMPGAVYRSKPGQFNVGGGERFELPPPPARQDPAHYAPAKALTDRVAAVSVGIVDGEVRVDLDYHDDSRAEVDMNVAYAAGGKLVEVQAAAEGGAGGFDREQMNRMLDLAVAGCEQLMARQQEALRRG